MIPYARQDVDQDDIDSVVRVLRSDWLTQGPTVPAFEKAIADYTSAEYAVAVSSATAALHISCIALGVGPGDWIWTSPNTFVASSNCALYCGASVDFVDIDPRTYNLSVDCLTEKLATAKLHNRIPKVVIAVHFAGQPCDMVAVYKLSQEYGFKVIEDASHALGATYDNHGSLDGTQRGPSKVVVGACAHSDVTIFSFHPVKILTTAEGGMATTNDPCVAEKMRLLRAHGITHDPILMEARPVNEIWNYQQIELGFNYRMPDVLAALGVSQLERLEEFLHSRKSIVEVYNRDCRDLPVVLPFQQGFSRSSFHLYPIRIRNEFCAKEQGEVYRAMREEGILVNLHYIPVYLHPYYQNMGFRRGYCPEAEAFYREALSLPIYPSLTIQQQEKVISSLSNILRS
jgi:UDP-4-amino-4,6-dideoxy-N-acetyl-beta-L-altrosamine transaminase